MKPMIKAVQEWLKTCPLVAGLLEDGVALRIDWLGAEPASFSLEDAPGSPVIEEYFNGRTKIKNYVLASRMEYSPDIAQQAANSGFWDDFSDWIAQQSDRGLLPQLDGGRQAEKAEVTGSSYIITADDGTCRFQIQLAIQYFQPK